MHDISIITTVAAAFTSAWLLGLLTQRLQLSPIVGYLLAGILLGPHTPGIVANQDVAQQLAEVGVILLMFDVGLHFSVKDLWAVRAIAIPGAIGQSLVATLVVAGLLLTLGLSLKTGVIVGIALSVASTVVLMRVLMDARALNSPAGHAAVGWLLVEDVLTVLVLVLIPIIAQPPSGGASVWATVLWTLAKLAMLVVLALVVGPRVIPWILVQVARQRSRELFTLTVLVLSVAIAAGSFLLFGASMALAAFLAGMVVGQSPVSHQAASDTLPIRHAFSVLFFVSVGMLFDPKFLLIEPWMILVVLFVILIVKPLAALGIVSLLGYPARTALTIAIGLAQIGEFSFIVATLARQFDLMPEVASSALVAGALISITLNPLLFRALPVVEARLRAIPWVWRLLNARAEHRLEHVNQEVAAVIDEQAGDGRRTAIVVGYGPVGQGVDRLLREAGVDTVIVDLNMETILDLKRQKRKAVYGDASSETILRQAGILKATHFILTLPHSTDRFAVVSAARQLNSRIRILVRARYLSERGDLNQAGASAVVFEEAEAGLALARLVLTETGASPTDARHAIRNLREQLT